MESGTARPITEGRGLARKFEEFPAGCASIALRSLGGLASGHGKNIEGMKIDIAENISRPRNRAEDAKEKAEEMSGKKGKNSPFLFLENRFFNLFDPTG